MIKALIFDFDGLILETEEPIYIAWQEIYQDYGYQITFDWWASYIGTTEQAFDPLEELQSKLGYELPREEIYRRQRKREGEMVQEREIMPGVLNYLEEAKLLNLKIGLASSSSCSWVTGHLERLGLIHYFDSIKASDDVSYTKPDPELYLAAIDDLGILPREGVVLEDSVNGIIAAKKSGLFCVWVPNALTKRTSTELADLRLDSLVDLPLRELLQRVESQLITQERPVNR
jgi:HAD superfamily hydrolase (TIGR01509 family)